MRRVFSYGGGVQSTAALVLASQKKIDFDCFVFCDVGKDSENPGTVAYVRDIAIPFAEKHNIILKEIYRKKKGEKSTILGNLLSANKSIGIPVYMSNGAPGNRSCTVDYKIIPIDQYIKKYIGFPVEVGIGISLDEFQRATTKYNTNLKTLVYPLLDLRLSRIDCINIIQHAGLPVPPKSSCWFCPFHSMETWQKMRNEEPEQFKKAVELEEIINQRRTFLGKDNVWLTRKLRPLPMATTDLQQLSFEDDFCESGYCFL
jgi:hypothetical protein